MKPKLQNWFIARAALVAASLFFAAFAVWYWASPLWAKQPIIAVAIGAGFAVSAVITPAVAPKLALAKGWSVPGLLAICLVFGCVDALGVSGGFAGLDKDLTQTEWDAALADYQTERETLAARLADAQAKLDAVPLPSATGEIRNRDTWQLTMDTLTEQRDAAQARLDALAMPVRATRFNALHVNILSGLIQLVLFLAMPAVEAARQRQHTDALAVYYAAKAEAEKRRHRKARIQAKTETRPAEPGPRLVSANP